MKNSRTRLTALAVGLLGGFVGSPSYALTVYATAESDVPIFQTDSQSGGLTASASAVSDAGNFARAQADATLGTIGVSAATNVGGNNSTIAGQYSTQFAGAVLNQAWSCAATCLFQYFDPITIQVTLHGTLNSAWQTSVASIYSPSLSGTVSFFGDTVNINYDPATLSLMEQYCPSGTCGAAVALPFTVLADGSQSYDTTLSFTGLEAGIGFSTNMSLQVGWDPATQPYGADFLNTLGLNVISNTTDVWTSEGGQTSIAGVPTSSVPEPATLSLLGLGLAGVGFMRKRNSKGAFRPMAS